MGIDAETEAHIESCKDNFPTGLPDKRIAFGVDGTIDRVRRMVAKRNSPESYERLTRLSDLGERITTAAAADSSCNIEWFQDGSRAGGHVSHLGRAMLELDLEPVLVGTFGTPPNNVFREELDGATLLPVGAPSVTDAVEFEDGKLMLSESGVQRTMNWDRIETVVGVDVLADHIDGTSVLGLGYWSLIPEMATIWEGIATELWPMLSDPPESILVDPGNLRRLSTDRVRKGLSSLRSLDECANVTVSANRIETGELARTLADSEASSDSFTSDARSAYEGLQVSRFVGHGMSEAVSIRETSTSRVEIPVTDDPVLTTSAGDHFNSGLVLSQISDMGDGPSLIVASALAGWFVRNGNPPELEQLQTFIETYASQF